LFEAQPDSEIVRDARLAGMDEGSLKALLADLDEGTDDGIWPAHVEIVRAFCAVGTQWRLTLRPDGFGVRAFWLGLDYTAVKVALEALGVTITRELWQGLTTMEQAAAAAMNGVTDQ
jgi:hypothetical protein